MNQEIYDSILDALDNENLDSLQILFRENNLSPYDKLYDNPRLTDTEILLETYLDYVLYYNLKIIIDFLVDEIGLEITDNIMAKALELQNTNTFNYFIEMGYHPSVESLSMAIKNCYSTQIETILNINNSIYNNELIHTITDDTIEYLFCFDINEETIETIRVLFNYGINKCLFSKYLNILKNPCENQYEISPEEEDIIIEIIDFFESNLVPE